MLMPDGHVRWKSGNRPILVQGSVAVTKAINMKLFVDPMKAPHKYISRKINNISIGFWRIVTKCYYQLCLVYNVV